MTTNGEQGGEDDEEEMMLPGERTGRLSVVRRRPKSAQTMLILMATACMCSVLVWLCPFRNASHVQPQEPNMQNHLVAKWAPESKADDDASAEYWESVADATCEMQRTRRAKISKALIKSVIKILRSRFVAVLMKARKISSKISCFQPFGDCGRCVNTGARDTVCTYCPTSRSCTPTGFAGDGLSETCSVSFVPINSENQCWSKNYPYQIGDFLSIRPASAALWSMMTGAVFTDPLREFPTYPAGSTGIFDLATGLPLLDARGGSPASRFVIAGNSDWGSGTGEAAVVAALMAAERPGMTLHLGDVYWVGTPEQFDSNVLGKAPNRHQLGVSFPKGDKTSFLLNGNHEMLSGGTGLFENGFSYTGQKTTYGVWQSDSWRFIALDSSYLCYGGFPDKLNHGHGARNVANETEAPQPDAVIKWLTDVVRINDPEDKRGIVLFSHHQPFSDWGPVYLGTVKQLNQIIPSGRTVIWFFGHEHRLALYEKLRLGEEDPSWETGYAIYPRMVGNGGFSDVVGAPNRTNSLRGYDDRLYQNIPQHPFPDAAVGFNGYFTLTVSGARLDASYVTGKCAAGGCNEGLDTTEGTVMATETYTVDLDSGELSQEFTFLHAELTTYPAPSDSWKATSDVPVEYPMPERKRPTWTRDEGRCADVPFMVKSPMSNSD